MRLGLACVCLPPALFTRVSHDLTLTRLDSTRKSSSAFVPSYVKLARKAKGQSGFVPSPHHHPHFKLGWLTGWADPSPARFALSRYLFFKICITRAQCGSMSMPISYPLSSPSAAIHGSTVMRPQAGQNTIQYNPEGPFCLFVCLLAFRSSHARDTNDSLSPTEHVSYCITVL